MAFVYNGEALRMKSFNDANFDIGISGQVVEGDVDKIETVLKTLTLDDNNAVIIGRNSKFYNDNYPVEVSSIDKTSELQTRKMVLNFQDAGALIIKGKFPLDPTDLLSIQTGMVNKLIAGEKVTSAVLGI